MSNVTLLFDLAWEENGQHHSGAGRGTAATLD
jgi:hypothetical protein